ncbi:MULTISPECIES: DUF927 domain-containing protein [unclassified Caballeronia]|uniref:DUF927 domain-containing protein n=1 Tax=unclassified Caballeronia TaxID=2646786 RepID=UPI00285DF4A0|nr:MULTISPECIES: DUF927 domain-containing protein [unclassified Caballeronia]MDR5772469.1 DUF927 domain-containing protein [Caballeronia sp. LZ002]MDR5847903.1 DUF927 domain-containing protein [Caballeronia sp. LZ003]
MSTVFDHHQRILEALSYIPPDCERDVWFRVAAALKNGEGEAAFETFDTWSKASPNYSAADTRDTWRSIRPDAGITIATLFAIAKQYGYNTRSKVGTVVDPKEVERRRAERDTRVAQDAQKREVKRKHAASLALAVIEKAGSARDDHPYLLCKGVSAVDTLREMDAAKLQRLIGYRPQCGGSHLEGRILIAPVTISGAITTVEMIDESGRKSALANGEKAGGCWFACALPEKSERILIAEGVATALSAHLCTGDAAVAALSAGNLMKVAQAMRAAHPDAEITVLADLGNGQQKAVEAARSVNGKVALPDFGDKRADNETDFNDMHTRFGAAAVASQIKQATKPDSGAPSDQRAAGATTAGEGELEAHYECRQDGLYFVGVKVDRDSGKTLYVAPLWLCSALEVLGDGRDEAGRQHRVLRWHRKGNREEIHHAMPNADIGEREGWATMRSLGLSVAPGRAARERLAYYLQEEGGDVWHEITGMTGWQYGAFVLPSGEFVGKPSCPLVYNGGVPKKSAYLAAGTVESWKSTVGELARENPLVTAAIACAFAGPLLSIIGARDGIGLHFYTQSSSGKSTAGDCAASVWGEPRGIMHSWDGTSFALSRTAEYANDGLLYLDEIGAGDARKIGPSIYQMLNGVSRLQGTKSGGVVASRSWRLTLISTGEVGMSQYLSEGGLTPRAGQEVRLLDVPADGGEHRAFDCIHGRKDGDEFSTELTVAARTNYGTAGRAFVAWLMTHRNEVEPWVKATQDDMLGAIDSEHPNAAPIVKRATRKWGVLVAAAEMASEAGLTGWTRDDARTWVMSAWARWLQAFGTKDRDQERLLEQVDGMLAANERSRFQEVYQDGGRSTCTGAILGYVRYDEGKRPTFDVLPSAFKTEVIAGFNERQACRALHQEGMLAKPKGHNGWTTYAGRLLGRVYRLSRRPVIDEK